MYLIYIKIEKLNSYKVNWFLKFNNRIQSIKWLLSFSLPTQTMADKAHNTNPAGPKNIPALGRPMSEWTPVQQEAAKVLDLEEDYLSKAPPRCLQFGSGMCWDLSHPEDRRLQRTPLTDAQKKAFICLGGTKEGYEKNVLGCYPCPLAGKCCYCRCR